MLLERTQAGSSYASRKHGQVTRGATSLSRSESARSPADSLLSALSRRSRPKVLERYFKPEEDLTHVGFTTWWLAAASMPRQQESYLGDNQFTALKTLFITSPNT